MPTSTPSRLRRLATKAIAGTAAVTTLLGGAVASADPTGIDVSRWQHGTSINWQKVKADGVTFTFIKATEGTFYANDYYDGDRKAAKRLGVYRAAYHYARPSIGSAGKQARYFLRKAGRHGARGDLPPVLDLEDDGGLSDAALQGWTRTWLRTVKRRTGRTPIIYTGPYFWESEMGNTSAFRNYPLWIAHYSTSSPRVPGGWTRWTFWQKSQTGRIDGISGAVDINKFNGTRRQLARLAQARRTDGDGGTDPGTGTTPETDGDSQPDPGTETPTEPAPEKTDSAVSLALSREKVFTGRSVEFSGRLRSSTGRALAGKKVALLRRAEGSATWTRITSLTTDTDGRYSISFAATGSATFRAEYRGNRRYDESSSRRHGLTVRPKVRTSPTLAVESVNRHGRAKVYGHLRTQAGRPVVGKTMLLYERLSGSAKWRLVSRSETLSPTGWYQAYVRPSRTAGYKAVFRGGVAYARSVSLHTTVRVR